MIFLFFGLNITAFDFIIVSSYFLTIFTLLTTLFWQYIQRLTVTPSEGTLNTYTFPNRLRRRNAIRRNTWSSTDTPPTYINMNFTNNMNASDEVDQLSVAGTSSQTLNAFPPTDVETQMDSIIESTPEKVTAEVVTGTSQLGSVITNITDATVKESEKVAHESIPRPLSHTADDATFQSIKLYLSKPTLVKNGYFDTTDTASTFPAWDVYEHLYSRSIYKDKVNAVFSFRATAVFTLQINATPFQQGRYIMAHVPTGGSFDDSNRTEWLRMHTFSLTNVTSLPHVEIDLSHDTQVQLKVPFVSWMNAMPLPNTTHTTPVIGSPGYIFMRPYVAVTAGTGSTSRCDYGVWFHMEDVELFGNVNTQADDIEFQGGMLENESLGNGPVSSALRIVSNSARLAKAPLNALLNNVGWAAEVAAGFAHTLGWSAPKILDNPERAQLMSFPNLTNYNSKKPVITLGLSEKNTVDVCPGFAASGVDELTIDYLKGIYAYQNSDTFDTADAVGSVIWDELVTPGAYRKQIADGLVNVDVMTPVGLLSTMFGLYRGSITYRIKMVKTQFHSGRLMVAVTPIEANRSYSISVPTIQDIEYLQKTIIDIRDCNEFEINVPFVSNTSWKSCGKSTLMDGAYTSGEPYARITIMVLNKLKCPDTVTQNVPLIIEVKGGEDLEFAMPRATAIRPIIPTQIVSQCADIELQSGEVTTGIMATGAVGSASSANKTSLIHETNCIGEAVTSLRQLLKRPYPWYYNGTGSNTYGQFVMTSWEPAVSNATIVSRTGTFDLVTLLSSLFCLRRGGTRLNIVCEGVATANMMYASLMPRTIGVTKGGASPRYISSTFPYAATSGLRTILCGVSLAVQRSDWGYSLETPMYATTHSQPTLSHMFDGTIGQYFTMEGGPTYELLTSVVGGSPPTYYGMRSGADDTNFGGFAGIPAMLDSIAGTTSI